jgi:hypothetical protein
MRKTIGLKMKKIILCPLAVLRRVAVLIVLGICPCIISAQTFDQNSATLTNSYLPIKAGDKFSYQSYGLPVVIYAYLEATNQETIDQVACLKVKESTSFDANLMTYYWLAEDITGNIWILQYYDKESNDLKYYGRNNAKLVMPSRVSVGSTLWNDSDPTETVVATGVTVPQLRTGLGPYYDCIKSKTDYGGGDIDFQYYAPGIGQVKWEANDDGINGLEIFLIERATVKKSKPMPWLPLLLD